MTTETEKEMLGFVLRALQHAEIEYHENPRRHTKVTTDEQWIEFTLFPEGTFRLTLERIGGGVVVEEPDEEMQVIESRDETPSATPAESFAAFKACAEQLPPLPPEADALDHPTPDDPKHQQVYAAMFEVCDGIREARIMEGTGDPAMSEELWASTINPAMERVFELLTPEPVVPTKQFHSGWNLPWEEAECTCAGTWLEAWQHIDDALKSIEGAETEVHEARSKLTSWMAYRPETAGWINVGNVTYWIAELNFG